MICDDEYMLQVSLKKIWYNFCTIKNAYIFLMVGHKFQENPV